MKWISREKLEPNREAPILVHDIHNDRPLVVWYRPWGWSNEFGYIPAWHHWHPITNPETH